MKTAGFGTQQQPTPMPIAKYRHFLDSNPVSLPDRTWPNNRITKAPRWLSTDLRDGNQALIDPMDPAKKRKMFDLLVAIGLKEIEVGFPAASKADFDFVRSLVEDDAVPEDVTISVLTQSRPEIIHRTVDALQGLPRATVHLYNATAPVFRDVVFNMNREQIKQLAVAGSQDLVSYMEKSFDDHTIVGLEYSPEIFVDTELDFALEVCEAVMDVWQPGPDREIILNLPTTVERSTPNVYADQIEWMSRNLSRREHIALSAHNHNDRGTGVATTELALLAGVDRVEGCLFGQGERTGNVDLVTVALNLFSNGIDPQLDLSNLDEIRRTVEHCTQMEVPPRTPYGGDLVYTSFSGSHQDAIKKGFASRARKVIAAGGDENAVLWEMPYLPIDPKDVGRSYEAVVRVNSQSGKGGVAYLLSSTRDLDLPRRLQVEVSNLVQHRTDVIGGEVTADELWKIFVDEYLPYTAAEGLRPWGRYSLRGTTVTTADEGHQTVLTVTLSERDGDEVSESTVAATGNGPIDAFTAALAKLGIDVGVLDYAEHALSSGGDATAASYVECEIGGQVMWGVGLDPSTVTAAFKAIVSAVNRALR
ncbi:MULTISPECIES: 2-isopropylmalate synthase [Trueperella]|uniref:2-isopropylmalate synthase n=1 Tax=Trueperella bernardiae TaxID=59561 RepID=A0A0W1KJI9_9ACTO|nr:MULTISPECIES: 2-isopropylmalate synthase [Trueperella]KTF03939.1 2-isopropylmalate synthase [Trueperella bernardiae]MCM3907753.1 2-isopropylmalate synthase [Trueperella bernardiae]MDK8602077.1 2-isopropylmalate synthase [Trueperella bernardiae]MDV6238477.1 2-isopropylmalate synthase [Trueperella bernardiae]OCW60135.1 2-isopropylmalate synthase [Trueperella bernardiae]